MTLTITELAERWQRYLERIRNVDLRCPYCGITSPSPAWLTNETGNRFWCPACKHAQGRP